MTSHDLFLDKSGLLGGNHMAREWEDDDEIIEAAPEQLEILDQPENPDQLREGGQPEQPGDGGQPDQMVGNGPPPMIFGICYIGRTTFSPCECIPLIAKVIYAGGNGSGIPVEFYICHRKYETRTVEGGIAALCIGKLGCGRYEVMARADGRVTTKHIRVKERCHRRRG